MGEGNLSELHSAYLAVYGRRSRPEAYADTQRYIDVNDDMPRNAVEVL